MRGIEPVSCGLAQRRWAGASIFSWYHSGQVSKWFKEMLASQGIDSAKVPSVVRAEC